MAHTPARRCVICGDALPAGARPDRRTCSPAHAKRDQRERAAKAKRAQRDRDSAAQGMGQLTTRDNQPNDDVAQLVGRKRDDAIREAFIDEVRPVVREAIDTDVVRSIQGLVGLVPSAVLALQDDLTGDDPRARSVAAALVIKYTMGNPNVTPPREDSRPQLTIINSMPDAASPSVDIVDVPPDADEVRRCDTCRLDKPEAQFPGDGPRCQQCMDERKAQVMESLRSGDALRQPGPAEDVQRSSGLGRPEVDQAGPRLQPGDLRAAGMDEGRFPDPPPPESRRPAPRPVPVREASQVFAGPPDPRRGSV